MIATPWFLLGALCLPQETPKAPEAEDRVLVSGDWVARRSLDNASTHRYLLNAKKGDRIEGFATQYGTDIQLRLYGPEREGYVDFDYSTERHEPFRRHAWRDGSYLLEVTTEDWEGGEYDLFLGLCEPEAEDLVELASQYFGTYPPHYPGFGLVVIQAGEIVFLDARGERTQVPGQPLRVDTPFHLKELSFAHYAHALLILQQQGRIAWEDSIRDHLPWFAEYPKPLVVEQLISHRYGYPDLRSMARWLDGPDAEENPLSTERARALLAIPFYLSGYGNRADPGFTQEFLLQELICAASGMPIEEAMRNLVFGPLGIKNTGMAPAADYPLPADGILDPRRGSWNSQFPFPPGQAFLFSTLEDVGRWLTALSSEPEHAATWEYLRSSAIIQERDYDTGLYYHFVPDADALVLERSLRRNGLDGLTGVRSGAALFEGWPMEHPRREAYGMRGDQTMKRPTKAQLERYCGTYRCEQADVIYTISRKEKRLWCTDGEDFEVYLDLDSYSDSLIPGNQDHIRWVSSLSEKNEPYTRFRLLLPGDGWVTFERVQD